MTTKKKSQRDCDLCGGEIRGRVWRDRLGGEFCSKYHRDRSTRFVRELLGKDKP